MVMMDAYYSHDRLLGLWETIDKLHLIYLQMDDGPPKLDHRAKLEDCIKDYLCIANHNQKFCISHTADVLYRSASNKTDFSGYKAVTGWNSIQLYAGNLISQPWRQEYRQIKTYCGFYKHQIEANLIGAEIMFETMGYKHFGDGVLILDGPICPDLVTSVSKDCLVAYMECQILKAIWEGISSNFPKTWLDILDFRKLHICSPEQAIRAINYQNQQKHNNYTDIQYGSNKMNQNILLPPLQQQVHNISSNSMTLPIMNCNRLASQSFPYSSNGCCNYAQVPQNYCTIQSTNGYCCTNGYGLAQNYYGFNRSVPTGQLIELEHGFDVTDKVMKVKVDDLKNRNEEDWEDWDYVYRNLKSQGYSKDLGERGDILKKKKPTNLDEALCNLTVNDRPLKISEALEKYDLQKSPENVIKEKQIQSRNSSYENISSKAITKTLPRNNNDKVNIDLISKSKTLDMKKMKSKRDLIDKWQCKSCTYLNENTKNICEMCSKSKILIEQQMEIGGPQCSKCTLVNPKDEKNCQACNESLKDSPTYI